METSALEYLASLRRHGHRPEMIGTAQIGRTVYAAGRFTTPERPAPAGSRAAAEGRPVPSETRLALIPAYRTDRVTHDSAGPTPALHPASWTRDHRTTYVDPTGARWYVAGWSEKDATLWLNRAEWMDGAPGCGSYPPPRPMALAWTETFDAALRLAGPEVTARIAAREVNQ